MNWDFLLGRIEGLRQAGTYREPDDGFLRQETLRYALDLGVEPVDASSNDYFGLSRTPVSRETVEAGHSVGSGASRLIHGTREAHRSLESAVAAWVDQPEALLFASGYAANIGVISALAQQGDLVISDALNHASIIDGCRLAKADIAVYSHSNISAVDSVLCRERGRRQCWVVTESYFSMDGDSPDLPLLRQICDCHSTPLIIDEAHALGVFGPQGSGLCRQHRINPDVLVGTFGKAVGAQGAFVASGLAIRNWLWNKARSFFYSTAMSPLLASAILDNLGHVRDDDTARVRLSSLVRQFRHMLEDANVPVSGLSYGPIVPIILGSPQRAMDATARLTSLGILVQAIRPPTVPQHSCRIRLTLNSRLSDEQLKRLANAIIETCAP
jgi:8-amino-7-oxononanoate synthase